MPNYQIQHRIKTLAQLWNPFEYRGFHFSHWNFTLAQGPISDAWIAEQTVEGENANKAFIQFREQLIPAVDRVAFVSQCFASLEYESFAIWGADREDGTLYFRHSREVDPVPLHFDEDQRASLVALERYEEKGDVFRLLRESGSASTFYTRLAMLLSSLEAIAGERKTSRFLTTDKGFIENRILKDKVLYKDLFAYGTGVRNKLLHGTKVAVEPGRDYIGDIYSKVVDYFNDEHGAQINKAVINPMRHPIGNYESIGLWLRPRDPRAEHHNLRSLVEFAESENRYAEIAAQFEVLANMPDGF